MFCCAWLAVSLAAPFCAFAVSNFVSIWFRNSIVGCAPFEAIKTEPLQGGPAEGGRGFKHPLSRLGQRCLSHLYRHVSYEFMRTVFLFISKEQSERIKCSGFSHFLRLSWWRHLCFAGGTKTTERLNIQKNR